MKELKVSFHLKRHIITLLSQIFTIYNFQLNESPKKKKKNQLNKVILFAKPSNYRHNA